MTATGRPSSIPVSPRPRRLFDTVTRPGPIPLTEHDAHEWAGPDEIPAVSDAVRDLVTR
ncbi:hypothetical protein GCM10009665_10880 [Kitasatospora nipponensis]|uniref:Uncharacterized protein n=1 Tax=Kitasatospora nipponensis TaxID=258049 RepID=A0ABN1VW97_9ACTN